MTAPRSRGPYDRATIEAAAPDRATARASGAKYFVATKPCPRGHAGLRRVSNSRCIECDRLDSRHRWASGSNRPSPEERRAGSRAYNNSPKGKESKRRWAEKDVKWAWASRIIWNTSMRAKKRGLCFDLDKDYVRSIAPDICPVFGRPLVYMPSMQHKLVPQYSASLDRLDPSKGYVRGNVAVISFKANLIKSSATAEEVRAVAEWMAGISKGNT